MAENQVFHCFLLRNPLFPDMDAFFKKSVENKASTENLQKTYKNQYYLMKNIRKNNKYHRKPSQKRRKKQKNANDINKKQWKTTNNVCFYMIFKNLGSDRIWRKIKFFIGFLLGNPLLPDMDAFFKKSVENEESTENLQKTHKNQYYLMKNTRKNNKYHRQPSQKLLTWLSVIFVVFSCVFH